MKGPKKKLIPFRLWESDIQRCKAKLVLDRTSFQKVCELLVMLYLNGNEEVMRHVKTVAKQKNVNKRRYTGEFDDLERSALYAKIEQISGLSETQQILEEWEKENK